MTAVLERLSAALAARYSLERELGAGGVATTYLAEDVKHRRKVALKVVRPDFAGGTQAAPFLREIRQAEGLHHPNILPLYDSGDAAGSLYYVIPVVEGESLRDRLQREKALSVAEAVHLAREVAAALDYAHRHAVVHCDIKPENILLHEGHALVTDFCIAKAVSTAAPGAALTRSGLAVATPAYMSPEQARGGAGLDGRSDLYSLGCVLYEMLAGVPPFTGATVQEVIARRLTDPPPDLTAACPSLPTDLAAVVRKLLAREPANRYATGAEASEALARAVLPRGVPAIERDLGSGHVHSIAVLPFTSQGAAPEDEYLADGMTEEIINALARLEGLRVAQRSSCFAFKGKPEALRTVGEKLGVRTILEGSLRKTGTRLGMTAQLSSAADGYPLWSERYDRELTGVFALQDELARAIAAKLRLPLGDPEPHRPARAGPRNIEAYQLLLKGRALLGQRGRAILEALVSFERAVELDPDLAEAHAFVGDACRLLAMHGMASPADVVPRARAAVERALSLDPGQVEALATLASITGSFDWDLHASSALTDRALARHHLHIRALCERAALVTLSTSSGPEIERALRDLRTAVRADPLNAWAAAAHALSLGCAGRPLEAIAEARRATELDPDAFLGRWVLVWILAAAGRDQEALAAAEPALLMSGRNPRILTELAAIHARRGEPGVAEAICRELRSRAQTGYIGFAEQGAAAAAAGHLDEARDLVARAVRIREPYLLFAKSAAWGPFRADPAGRALLDSAGPGSRGGFPR